MDKDKLSGDFYDKMASFKYSRNGMIEKMREEIEAVFPPPNPDDKFSDGTIESLSHIAFNHLNEHEEDFLLHGFSEEDVIENIKVAQQGLIDMLPVFEQLMKIKGIPPAFNPEFKFMYLNGMIKCFRLAMHGIDPTTLKIK